MAYEIIYSEDFEHSFSRIKQKELQNQIIIKIQQLKERAPLGKKLQGNSYWSVHVNKFRIIYLKEGNMIKIIQLLKRKFDYREL
ncbi:MAG TPA: type II toxin-antitoxin system RelE/ParE family toxin [Candidatus Nanoarchaeia archaeon]|nr:type II toxin-antitoxin system RelE/ParE family toxin [Candidatus Nanoarchaeia archaeon]